MAKRRVVPMDEEWQDDWEIVAAPAEMDGRDAVEMVRRVLAGESDVIIDLTDTELLTSDGCEALVEMHTLLIHQERSVALRAREGGLPWRVIRVTGLDDRFAVLTELDQLRGTPNSARSDEHLTGAV
jgi:anti-anti-sigma regulatory factor